MRLKITVELEGKRSLDDMLDEGEVAKLLGCTRSALVMARKARNGGCPPYTITGARTPMYRLRDVLAWAQINVRVIGRKRTVQPPRKNKKRVGTVITGVFDGKRQILAN